MITDGTRIRLCYQISIWDTGELMYHVADAGREFVAIDGIDTTERGSFLNVVEPDEYGEEVIESCLVIDDLDAIEVIE